MKIATGYLYYIKDSFFEKIQDSSMMVNHENKRPSYLVLKNKNLLWFIPLSSKIEKYEKIINYKIKKYGECKTIMIEKIAGKKSVILLQNSFPITEKYIDHEHKINNVYIHVISSIEKEILENFNYMLNLKEEGKNLFFTDIDRIKNIMLEETLDKS